MSRTVASGPDGRPHWERLVVLAEATVSGLGGTSPDTVIGVLADLAGGLSSDAGRRLAMRGLGTAAPHPDRGTGTP